MSRTHDRQDKLTITDYLRLAKNATMEVVQSDGSTSTIDLAELAALDNIGAADLAKIDGITDGTGAASKALVLDANGTVLLPAPMRYDHNTTITAFATGGQASATALTGEFNEITTCATAGDSVKLPSALGGEKITVKNSGATSAAVFPATSDSINGLAANLSVNLPVGATLVFHAISATVWETQQALVLTAPTTQKGELVVKASDNAADHEIILTNASHGQATTITIPDGGAATSYVVQSTAALTLAEADVLDGATAGTGVVSKAVVLDANGNFIMPDNGVFGFSRAAVAAAGSTSTDATVLADQVNAVTGADGAKGVALPAAATTEGPILVINTDLSNGLKVYPVDAGDDNINSEAEDAAVVLAPGAFGEFIPTSATQWYVAADALEGFHKLSTEAPAGITGGSGTVYKTSVQKSGGIITTSILIDITGLTSSATNNDIIGVEDGVAYIGQITAARNGTILGGKITCLEAPTTGDPDIDLYSATENTGAEDTLITDLTETALHANAESWTLGMEKALTAVPAANEYLYLTVGNTGVAGLYNAGKFLIELKGY